MTTSLGIDIGGTSIKAALLVDDRPVWTGSSARYQRPLAQDIATHLLDLLRRAPLAAATAPELSVGLCVPGVLADDGESVQLSVNMPGLTGVRLRKLIDASLPAGHTCAEGRFRIVSDVHAAALDASLELGLQGRVLGISLGTGVGAIVLDGERPLVVTGRSSGHFGQMDVTVAGIEPVPVGPDGGRGSLEGYIGVIALARRHGDVEGWLGGLRGDEPELAALARAIRIAHAIYRPHHVLLLGGVGIRLASVLAALRSRVGDALTSLADPGWTLASGRSDHHAAQGAARLSRGRQPA